MPLIKDNRNRTEYYKNRDKKRLINGYNTNRFLKNKQKYYARKKASKIPLALYCELCPDEDKRLATERHHPDYNYCYIFISVCEECHISANETQIEY